MIFWSGDLSVAPWGCVPAPLQRRVESGRRGGGEGKGRGAAWGQVLGN